MGGMGAGRCIGTGNRAGIAGKIVWEKINVGLDLGIAGVLFYIHSHRVLCGSFYGTKDCSVWLAGSAYIHIVGNEGISRRKGGNGLWI